MVIYGCGGHAKVLLDAAVSNGIRVTGFFDDYNIDEVFEGLTNYGQYSPDLASQEPIIVGIGNNGLRQSITRKITHRFATVSDTNAYQSTSVQIGEGSVLFYGSIVQAHSIIGKHVIINTGAQIDHDCHVLDFSHIGPGAILCGGVTVGHGALVGAGATIIPQIKIGNNAIIGAGAVVTKDIPDDVTAVGNPAKYYRNG